MVLLVLLVLAESIKELQRAPAKRNLQVRGKYRGYGAIGAFRSFNVMLGAKLFRLSRRIAGYFAPLFIYCSLFYYDGFLIQSAFITESFCY